MAREYNRRLTTINEIQFWIERHIFQYELMIVKQLRISRVALSAITTKVPQENYGPHNSHKIIIIHTLRREDVLFISPLCGLPTAATLPIRP